MQVKSQGRGFASLSQEKRREIAQKGGKAAHAQGRAYTWTSEKAREAGRKGGQRSRRQKKRESAQNTDIPRSSDS